MRTPLAAIFLTGLLWLASATGATGQHPRREVLTRADLVALSIHRYSDLLQWLGTGASTVEGIGWQMGLDLGSVPDPRGAGARQWLVTVDGQPVETELFGAVFPELLPVALSQVDSVTVVRGPTVAGGVLAGGGAIRLHTSTRPGRATAGAWVRHGAETGDPGPYVYTPYSSRGIDQTGPDGAAWAAIGASGFSVGADARYLRTDVSDSRLRQSWGTDHPAFTQARGGSARIRAESGQGQHQVLVSRQNQLGHAFFPALQDFRRGDLTVTHLGLNGEWRVGNGSEVRYRAVHSRVTALMPARPEDARERERTRASADVRREWGAWSLLGGLGWDGDGALGYASIATPGDARLAGQLAGALRHGEHGWGGYLATGVNGRVRPGWGWDAAASAFRDSADEGWDGAAPHRASESIVRLESGLSRDAGQNSGRIALVAGTASANPLQGYFGLKESALLRFHPSLTAHLLHEFVVGGGSERVPTHSGRARLDYRVAPSFALAATFQGRSSVSFPHASKAAAIADSTLPPFLRMDVSAEKGFWRQRVRTELVIRNVFDAPERLHPDGAEFSLRYFVAASLQL